MGGKRRKIEGHLHKSGGQLREREEIRVLRGVVYTMKSIEGRKQSLGEHLKRKYERTRSCYHF